MKDKFNTGSLVRKGRGGFIHSHGKKTNAGDLLIILGYHGGGLYKVFNPKNNVNFYILDDLVFPA